MYSDTSMYSASLDLSVLLICIAAYVLEDFVLIHLLKIFFNLSLGLRDINKLCYRWEGGHKLGCCNVPKVLGPIY